MEYLKNLLGIRVDYETTVLDGLSNYIYGLYRLESVRLDGRPAIFVYPKEEMAAVNIIKKHLNRIEKTTNAAAILIPKHLSYRQKSALLQEHIPFIVDGKQIYLPFMAVYLQERNDGEKPERNTILPSAQLLLLYFIYQGCQELKTSDAARALRLTPTSISRASRQLEEMTLIRTEKRGIQKIILSDDDPQELFEKARPFLINPIKKTFYIKKAGIKEPLLLSGCSALSEYTMINPSSIVCYAASGINKWQNRLSNRLNHSENECQVEFWAYDPKILSNGEAVDPLSLALTFRNDQDERLEAAVDEMLTALWEEIDGQRN